MVKRHGLKKGLSLVLVLCLILSLMPTVALAQEPTAATGTEAAVGVTGTGTGTETTTPGGGETGTETTTPSTENGAGTTTPAAGEAGTGTTTPGGSETGTETTTPGAEDETEKDDPLDDFLDDVLKPLPGDTGDTTGQTGSGETAGQTGGDTNANPDGSEGQTPNIPTVDVNGPKPEAPEGVVKPDTTVPQDPATAPSDPLPELPPTDSQPVDGQPVDGQPVDGQPVEEVPEVQEEAPVTASVVTETGESVTITVTGPGLTGLTVVAVPSVTTLPAESEQVDYVAYNITPMAGDEPYTGEADVTIPVPAGWDEDAEIHGFVVNGKGAEEPVTVVEVTPSEDGTSYTFRAPHFSVMGLYADPQPLELKQEYVTVSVDQETTIPVPDVDLRNLEDKSNLNEAIATVDVSYQEIPGGITANKVTSLVHGESYYISDGKGNYLTLSGDELTNATKLEEATQWTYDRNGRLSANGYYLTYTTSWGRPNGLNISSRSGTKWTYDGKRIYYAGYTDEYPITYNNGWTMNSGTSAGAYEKVTTGESKATLIKITGVSEGTTSVIVGDTQYNITVEEQAPAGALGGNTLTVEYWITNSKVYESSEYSPSSVTISKEDASDPAGVDIAEIVKDPANSYYDGKVEVHFWQAMRLDAQNHQTGDSGDDETADGTAFTRVRYYKNAWQYYADGKWHWFLSGDQAVAYYMRYTEVTTEVTTAMKDWGYDPKETTPDTSSGKGQVALSVAVVYPDGKLSPAEDAIYRNSTTIFNFWQGRDIGIIAPLNNEDYEVTKITVTDGTRVGNSYANVWYSSDSITWEKKTLENGTQWYDEEECWTESDGGVPTINGASMGITWSEKNTAKLVLIYIQPIEKETNLNVVWYDDSAKKNIYSTQVVVSSTGEKTFFNSLMQTSKVPQQGGEFTLDDEAYVVNSSNVHQTFSKNLATLQGDIAAQYRSGLYKYVKAELSADGKTLTLHYQIDDSKLDHRYVVDFGLPVKVPLSDLVEKVETVASVTISETTLAKVESDKSITFQPDAVMDAEMVITANLAFTGGGSQDIQIGFVPASTVYYEEGFMTLENGFTGGEKGTMYQETSKLGAGTVYGYDAAYDGETGASNGSEATSTEAGSTASFSFTGTGVDIYANCNTGTGVVMIKVYDDASKLIKLLTVDTAMKNGDTPATENQAVTAYNIPIASIDGLDYGEYTVEIVHVAGKNKEVKPVYLDGFRVHQPLGISDGNRYYGADTEAGAEISELRDAVLRVQLSLNASDSKKYKDQLANAKAQVYARTGDEGASAVVLSYAKNAEEKVAIDILDNGPKNEIYLGQNETLVFKVADSAENVQVGLKLLTDGAACTINGKAVTSSTDMFYKVTPGTDGYVTIENTGTGLLAVTELKIAGRK